MAAVFRKDEQARETALMQLPDPPESKRSLWQTALFLGCMIAMLVFSDWANPSLTTIERSDGTKMKVAVLLETTDTLRVQIEEPVAGLKKGTKLVLPKTQIANSEYTTPAGYEWAAWIYVNRWYFAFAFLAATVLMAGLLVRSGGTQRLAEPDLGLRQVDHPVAVRRRVCHRVCGGPDPGAASGQLGRRQQLAGQSRGLGDWRHVVFRDADRDPDPGSTDRPGNGPRPGAGTAAGWSRHLSLAEHRGHLQRAWLQKDGRVSVALTVVMSAVRGDGFRLVSLCNRAGASFEPGIERRS